MPNRVAQPRISLCLIDSSVPTGSVNAMCHGLRITQDLIKQTVNGVQDFSAHYPIAQ